MTAMRSYVCCKRTFPFSSLQHATDVIASDQWISGCTFVGVWKNDLGGSVIERTSSVDVKSGVHSVIERVPLWQKVLNRLPWSSSPLSVDGKPIEQEIGCPVVFSRAHQHLLICRGHAIEDEEINRNQNGNTTAAGELSRVIPFPGSDEAANLVFPGVGAFGSAMNELHQRGLVQPLKDFLTGGAPFLGICLGLQCLCSGSEENEGVEGLGIIDAKVKKLRTTARVPHIGWNTLELPQKGFLEDSAPSMNQCDNHRQSRMEACAAKFCLPLSSVSRYYFDHSYCLEANDVPLEWTISQTLYGGLSFVSALRRGNIMATQFHPEKSAQEGEDFFRRFAEICVEFQAQSQREQKCGEEGNFILENGLGRNKKISEEPDGCFGLVTNKVMNPKPASSLSAIDVQTSTTRLAKRVVACLDVRANDDGKMVVTKGLQFAVRGDDGNVRSLGDPVSLSEAYYNQGVDELVFLNITSFRSVPLADFPTLELLRNVSKKVFVPLTIGGGIRDVCDEKSGEIINSSDEIADAYFLAGADKVSIGGDAILAAEEFLSNGRKRTGLTSIERISKRFGSQAVVVSLDPRRKYVSSPEATRHKTIRTKWTGPEGETFCYFECLIRGGREARDIGVFEAAEAVECLGAGEILLNSVDADGRCSGFDLELINGVRACTTIPIIASSGAGTVDHFREVFEQTGVEAALAAGIFHRGETTVKEVKNYLQEKGFAVR